MKHTESELGINERITDILIVEEGQTRLRLITNDQFYFMNVFGVDKEITRANAERIVKT